MREVRQETQEFYNHNLMHDQTESDWSNILFLCIFLFLDNK